ncbi:MAG: hypothetical protein PHE87_10625 [Victivallaceae bacterium]|nr:hypothetical protein [Victivallaceae bacterium]
MNWTLCSERLPELKHVSDTKLTGITIKNPDEWEGLVWFKGYEFPFMARRTDKYFGFTDGYEGWLYEIVESDFDCVKWADFPSNPFEAAE